MLSSLIDAVEKRHVRVIDIKGAFLKAKVPENLELLVNREGQLVQMMSELQPDFKIQRDGFMYLKCVKALYGHVKAARLFYDNLNRCLTEEMGFVRTIMIRVYKIRTEDGIMIVRMHVDDLNVSSVSERHTLHL
jgi:hypothetical protein